MAQLTTDGKVVSSGKGERGMTRSWDRAAYWIRRDLPNMAARIKAARRGR